MRAIISAVPLILALAASPATAQDEAAEPATPPEPTPAATPATPPAAPAAEAAVLRDDVPDRYVVVKGDTLWGISSRFLKNPWKWPDVWGINRDHIRNPHWIYPGDVIILDLSGATPRLRLEGSPDGGMARWLGYELQLSQLSPQMRGQALNALPIPTIPAKAIDPFLLRTMIVTPAQVTTAPVIVANTDKRVIVSAGDTAYVTGLDRGKGANWQVYRRGRMFQDPQTKEILGLEAIYLGDAAVTAFGQVSTVHIAKANQEIAKGDRLGIAPPLQSAPYIPRAPAKPVNGLVIAGSDDTVSEMGTYSVVIINRGARDGLETGHVLGLYHSEGVIPTGDARGLQLPDQQYGLILVFRVFDKMSYGLVMVARRPVHVLDSVRHP